MKELDALFEGEQQPDECKWYDAPPAQPLHDARGKVCTEEQTNAFLCACVDLMGDPPDVPTRARVAAELDEAGFEGAALVDEFCWRPSGPVVRHDAPTDTPDEPHKQTSVLLGNGPAATLEEWRSRIDPQTTITARVHGLLLSGLARDLDDVRAATGASESTLNAARRKLRRAIENRELPPDAVPPWAVGRKGSSRARPDLKGRPLPWQQRAGKGQAVRTETGRKKGGKVDDEQF